MKSNQPDRWGAFAKAPLVLTRCGAIPPTAYKLYVLLVGYAQKRQNCWPSVARLAVQIGRSVRTVQRHMRWLERHGLVHRQDRGRHTSLYTLLEPDPAVLEHWEALGQRVRVPSVAPVRCHQPHPEVQEGEIEGETLSQLSMPVTSSPTSQAGCRQYSTGVGEAPGGRPEEEASEDGWDVDPFPEEGEALDKAGNPDVRRVFSRTRATARWRERERAKGASGRMEE